MFTRLAIAIALSISIASCGPKPTPTPDPKPFAKGTQVTLTVPGTVPVPVFISFGADSKIVATSWASFCTVTAPLNCNFALTGSKLLPNDDGAYLNMTLAFGGAVGCGATKAELNVNNPAWYDVLDVSLVDGYSNNIEMEYKATDGAAVKIGPPVGKDGNEKVFGLYPYGCDICTARQNPPCGIAPGGTGCKAGTQYKPDVPCQFQGSTKGGGGTVDVRLLGVPASPAL